MKNDTKLDLLNLNRQVVFMVGGNPAEKLKASLSQNAWATREKGALCVSLPPPASWVILPKFSTGMLSTLLWSNWLHNVYIPQKLNRRATELFWILLQCWKWRQLNLLLLYGYSSYYLTDASQLILQSLLAQMTSMGVPVLSPSWLAGVWLAV